MTQVQQLDKFFTAEEYHQNYFDRNQTEPYCQIVISPKVDKLLSKYGSLVKTEEKK